MWYLSEAQILRRYEAVQEDVDASACWWVVRVGTTTNNNPKSE